MMLMVRFLSCWMCCVPLCFIFSQLFRPFLSIATAPLRLCTDTPHGPQPSKTFARLAYRHPQYSMDAIRGQKQVRSRDPSAAPDTTQLPSQCMSGRRLFRMLYCLSIYRLGFSAESLSPAASSRASHLSSSHPPLPVFLLSTARPSRRRWRRCRAETRPSSAAPGWGMRSRAGCCDVLNAAQSQQTLLTTPFASPLSAGTASTRTVSRRG